jgi:diguanylate cyclase (GGDEF)-like protein
MDRRPGRRAVRTVLALLAVSTALAITAVLRVLPATQLDAAGLGWALTALASVLLAAAAIGTVGSIVIGLRRGALSALFVAGASAALVGGSVALLAGIASISLTVTAATVLILAATVAERLETLVHGRRARLAIAGGLLFAAEAAAVVEILPVGADSVAPLGTGLLLAAAALGGVGALVVIGRDLAPASGLLAIGSVSLALARGGDALFALGLAALIAGVLLAARAALGAERVAPAAVESRELPPLADQLADGVLRFDGRLQLRSWNPAATRLLGLDEASAGERLEDLLGLSLQQLPTVEDAAIQHALLGGLDLSIRRTADTIDVVVRETSTSADAERLGRELRGTIEELLQARRTIDLQRAELERAAAIDPLTGIASRGAILDRLRVEVAQARRYQHSVAVVLIDVDHFGELNAIHGIAGGDAVLREVALRVRLRVREADALGRSGSDGLLAILPHTDEGGAAIFADALLRRIGQRPVSLPDADVAVSVSVGVAVMRPGEDLDVDGLLARGEEALASARGAGGDRIALDRLHGLARLESKARASGERPSAEGEAATDDGA